MPLQCNCITFLTDTWFGPVPLMVYLELFIVACTLCVQDRRGSNTPMCRTETELYPYTIKTVAIHTHIQCPFRVNAWPHLNINLTLTLVTNKLYNYYKIQFFFLGPAKSQLSDFSLHVCKDIFTKLVQLSTVWVHRYLTDWSHKITLTKALK